MTTFDPHFVANGILTFVASLFGYWVLGGIVLFTKGIRCDNPGWMTQVSIAIGLGAALIRVAALRYFGI